MHLIWLFRCWISVSYDCDFTTPTSIQKSLWRYDINSPIGSVMAHRVSLHSLWHPPTKWLMRSNKELHSQFTPGPWDLIHRTDCRRFVSPNPGHLWSSKSLFPSFCGRWSERHPGETWTQKICWKVPKKKQSSHITTLSTVTRAEICRPDVPIQQTFRFIASAAAPRGPRLIAGWIKQ